MPRLRPRPADLGLSRLAIGLAAMQIVICAAVFLTFRLHGLSLIWGATGPVRIVQVGVGVLVWLYFFLMPGSPREWIIAETASAYVLAMTLGMILAPAQYAGLTLNRPLIDSVLAAGDRAVHINVSTLAVWTARHPSLSTFLLKAYYSLLPQFVLVYPTLCFITRDRNALWEYTFNFHVCATVSVAALTLFPAACAPHYYGVKALVDQTKITSHILGVRSGAMTVIPVDQMDGLVSMPSFHAAGAMILVWAVRRTRWLSVPLAALNTVVILSTFVSGAHYFVDVPGAAVVVVSSIWLYRRWVQPRAADPNPRSGSTNRIGPDRQPGGRDIQREFGSGQRLAGPVAPPLIHPPPARRPAPARH